MNFALPRVINTEAELTALFVDPNSQAEHMKKLSSKINERIELIFKRTRCAEAQNWKCCYCGREMTTNTGVSTSVTLEHVTPQSQGGTHNMDNLVAACYKCNQKRGSKPLDENYQLVHDKSAEGKANHLQVLARQIKVAKNDLLQLTLLGNKTKFDRWLTKLKFCDMKVKKEFIADARKSFKLYNESSHLRVKKIIWKKEATLQQLREAEKTIRRHNLKPFTYPKVFEDDVWVTVILKEEKK